VHVISAALEMILPGAAGQAWGETDDNAGAFDQFVLLLLLLQAKPGVRLMMIWEHLISMCWCCCCFRPSPG
jgi:hypothetical protein